MSLGKRNKVSAEFSMSSLTDIIFLLLIFFMLTSSVIQIQDKVDLPESDSKTVAPQSTVVSVLAGGRFKVDGNEVSDRLLAQRIEDRLKDVNDRSNFTVAIVTDQTTEFKYITRVMEAAGKLGVQAII
ncbi:MAG: biopolymer transporter ExbD, partial [Saprospiraceae bacterium]|nr:biopolymer transporter ExbD [Saprospiraceae bacterium]